MGTVIIFALVTILCAIATLRELRRKNALAIFFSGASLIVFGWFTIMTIIGMTQGHGIPTGH